MLRYKIHVQLLSNVVQLTLSQNKPILTQLIFDYHHHHRHHPTHSNSTPSAREPNFILINFTPFSPRALFHVRPQFSKRNLKPINPRTFLQKITRSIESSQLIRSKDVCERMWSKDKILVCVPKRVEYSCMEAVYASAIASEICP